MACEWIQVTSGVPQGSVLGPTLFVAAVHSIPEVTTSSVVIYADDTKVYRPVGSQRDIEALQEVLEWIKGGNCH